MQAIERFGGKFPKTELQELKTIASGAGQVRVTTVFITNHGELFDILHDTHV